MTPREPAPEQGAGTPGDTETVRWPLIAKIGVALAVLTVVAGIIAALVAAFVVDGDDGAERIVTDIAAPVAPVALTDGELLVAERRTGRVLRVTRDGDRSEVVSVMDDLVTEGQRGLLGLVVRRVGEVTEIYASWTRASDGRLVVGQLVEGEQMLVWEGPISADLANGGTLAFRGSELLIGVGELQAPDLVDDPSTPNGKVLALDPAAAPDQTPTVVAAGLHNPFALDVVGDSVWVVDNAPGSDPERLIRITDAGDESSLDLEGTRAPSARAVLPDGDLALCGFVSGVVERIPVPETGVRPPTEEIGPPCATGVAVLVDGSIVTTTEDAIWRDPNR